MRRVDHARRHPGGMCRAGGYRWLPARCTHDGSHDVTCDAATLSAMIDAVQIRHRTKRSTIGGLPHTVPNIDRPIRTVDRYGRLLTRKCPTCGVHHPCKTTHLWLDDTGACLIAPPVLDELKAAGMPDLDVVGSSAIAPPISLNLPRSIVDRNNRAISPLTPAKVRAI